MTRAPRRIIVVKLTPAAGADGVRMLRWALKALWRRYRLRCVSVEQERVIETAPVRIAGKQSKEQRP